MAAADARRCRIALASAEPADLGTLALMNTLAEALMATGELDEAEALYKEVHKSIHAVRTPDELPRNCLMHVETVCVLCGKSKLDLGVRHMKMCARCKSVRYCDRRCQKAHWHVAHKHECMRSV